MLTKMDVNTSLEFLKSKRFGHLGCVLESGEPYVLPVNFLFEKGQIYIHSMPGQKITAMKNNPKICLQIETVADDGFEWQSVIAFGEFKEVLDPNKKMKILFQFYEKFPRFTPVEASFEEKNSAATVVIFTIKIERLTGVEECY